MNMKNENNNNKHKYIYSWLTIMNEYLKIFLLFTPPLDLHQESADPSAFLRLIVWLIGRWNT